MKILGIIKNKKGESLAETLVALLITSMGLIILPGAIVASSNVSRKVNDVTYNIQSISSGTLPDGTVPDGKVSIQDIEIADSKRLDYKSKNGVTQSIYFYSYKNPKKNSNTSNNAVNNTDNDG